jgi:FkbM family methyltransferase
VADPNGSANLAPSSLLRGWAIKRGGVPVPVQLDERLIVDVGAHRGEDSDFYLKLGYRVVAVEANPELVAHLAKRFEEEIEQGRLVIVPNAINESNDQVTFYVNRERSIWGTTDPTWAARNERIMGAASDEIQISCIRFEHVLERHGSPLYLKIDIEGADLLCLDALERVEAAARPRFVSLESTKVSWRDLRNEFDAFERLGYSRFQVVDQREHPAGRFRTVDGGCVDHEFTRDASGPFGDDLPRCWLTKRQALMRYVPIFVLYNTTGHRTPLKKIVRRVPRLRRILGWSGWYDTHAAKDRS